MNFYYKIIDRILLLNETYITSKTDHYLKKNSNNIKIINNRACVCRTLLYRSTETNIALMGFINVWYMM